MANGNGNNINTDDAAAAAAAATTTTATTQDQQHLTGDGGGGAVKLRGNNINDLVADLWLNGTSGSNSNSRGDYTNIRATTTTTAATATTAAAATSTTTNAAAAATSSSTFSFKHFLNSSGTITAPSSTVTSLDTACGSNSSNNTNALTTSASTSSTSTSSLQTSTGARPKVPQSASVSHMQPDLNGSAASKMKRSPRFSSFDSQASLAEYAACGSGSTLTSSASSGSRLRPDLRLEVERSAAVVLDDDDYEHVGLAQVRNSCLYDDHADDDVFPSPAGNLSHASTSSSRYVPRSYSSYDMPPTCPSSSPRRRPALRPNRLVLSSAPKMKLDLPLDTSNVAGAASALPDFVQDHLPDSWCQEAHLSSPPSSPLGAAEAPSCSGAAGGGGGGSALLLPAAACQLASNSSSSGGNNASLQPTGQQASNEASGSGSTGKMLPDFLSDGPILHSSQRLADVAIGLPSNSIDSPPQEADNSTLRQQNEQLQRELQETRDELSVQTRRAHEFEQQLLALTDARRRETQASSAQTQSTQRLRRQVAQLEAELFALRGGSDLVSGVSGASVITPGSSHSTSSSSNASRPSRTHHLSRDLLRAADSAEQNLRQMLAGVDNLRQIAANLEQPQAPAATPRSPSSDPYTDFK